MSCLSRCVKMKNIHGFLFHLVCDICLSRRFSRVSEIPPFEIENQANWDLSKVKITQIAQGGEGDKRLNPKTEIKMLSVPCGMNLFESAFHREYDCQNRFK